MSRKVGNFEVLGKMAADNLDIMMCPDTLNMRYSDKKKGTTVEFGAPGNIIAGVISGDKKAVMLMWDMKQFRELKEKMEMEED